MHIMKQLFLQFEEKGIEYAHFKSNGNLDFSFNETGDFDVLVNSDKIDQVYEVLLNLNAKQMNTDSIKKYPGVDNWLLFDDESGKIHHLHLHYQLMSGKEYVKEYNIPWEDIILNTRVKDPEWNIFITDPSLELILLSVRMVIKAHTRDYAKAITGMYKTHSGLQQERDYLISKADSSEIESFLNELFLKEDIEKLAKLVQKSKLTSGEFLELSEIIRKNLKNSRRLSGFNSFLLSKTRRTEYIYKRIIKKLGHFVLLKKYPMNKGAIIAFIGVDGSGKSTTTKEIYKWLSKQFDCSRVYMGLGDGKTTLYATVMKKLRKLFGGKDNTPSINSDNYKRKGKVSFLKNPAFFIKKVFLVKTIYSVEKDNYRKIILMNKYRINGGISVMDRFPQIELPNRNDGPKIAEYANIIDAERFVRRYRKKEEQKLQIVKAIKPDIIFRLNISAEESMRRKHDQSDITVAKSKINDLLSIGYQGARVIDIDAEQEYDKELLEIKKYIWSII